ncbi:MAG: aspartate carbamoyltransferase catalytic subunit [Zetaproteobacteria bacterium CG_4_9_14_3_um_filter_49_83]|nr:MAG: aspartate carbamoyltransferase [Zetaproteobacteria bacterium CG1_02_49_23]PIQ33164.1 MAG: aspartate carbamoyltransferase catalytic subunit [Zetaproteobacteria bacterium CG17_big_fil_post_rev_8_21_14_2_50_50_13]PIV29367.1 MAG: aspartate carbamoyltransferase catalytic subunit [Zetaproteobacteria bacterium CG02_land_8_20_14_3_00_50_9]PIY54801.1 MAG: aspartate carbamoyltransferase catalytic subunit [Zetaproteobacteria bacterium CG_4_10_14_0_8_um_filter_49_80]PJA33671.1 MAG: aspartate carbam
MEALKHLFGIADLSKEQIEHLVNLGDSFIDINRRPIKKAPTLRGKTIINLFFENSTRTRTSFELAGKRLSADVINISASTSATSKGESLLDTGQTLAAMQPHVLVIRHSLAGTCEFLAEHLEHTAIVNAGDGAHEHPTQILTDLLTLKQAWGSPEGKTMTIVGDISHSRVARSHLLAAKKLGYHMRVVAPKTLLPSEVERYGCEVYHNFDEALPGSDVVYMLRIQTERLTDACAFPSIREYHEAYGLNAKRLKAAGEDCIVMHPGPMNRGVEISSDVADSLKSHILNQVEHGVAVRMAVLATLCGGHPEEKPVSKKKSSDEVKQAQGSLL